MANNGDKRMDERANDSVKSAPDRPTTAHERAKPPIAVVLLSGGLDSATALGIAVAAGYECYVLSFDYGQRSKKELACARALTDHYADQVAQHTVAPLPLDLFGGSALTDHTIDLPTTASTAETGANAGGSTIPVSYVPARNTILLAFALAYAEVRSAHAIFIGVNAVDYSGYPDCRPEFIDAFQTLATLATKQGVEGNPVRIEAPLQYLSKQQIVERGLELGVPYELTWSCYDAGDEACGVCDSCRLRLAAFEAAGTVDPIPYR